MADLYLYEDIEPGAAGKFVAELNKIPDEDVTLHVSSYGGDVFDGLVMMNALRSHRASVTAVVEGVAASIASVIVVGGAGRVVMRPGSRMMIHNALTVAVGNADELDSTSKRLREMSSDLAKVYADRAGTDVAEWQAAMDAETWFSADEAVAAGLADVVEDGRPAREEPVLASAGSRMMNKFRGRRGDPPAALLKPHPEGGERGDDMSLSKEDIVAIIRDEFQKFKNEAVPISGEVDVTYPVDKPIIPTEKITVEPIIGESSSEGAGASQNAAGDAVSAAGVGLAFELGDAPEGWDTTIDTESGVVTVKAPSGAEVGASVEIPVTVNGTEVALSLKVRGLSEDEDDTEPAGGGEPAGGQPPVNSSAPEGMSVIPTDHLNYLNQVAKNFGEQQSKIDAQANQARVDQDIKAGRFIPAHRAKALELLERDPRSYADTWGSLPENTVPVTELGHAGADDVVREVDDKEFDARAVAAARRKEGK